MRARVRVWSDDSGASLAMALIFVTVVAVVIGSVLSFADVNFRTATALRQQSEEAAAADGAGQIAVNALRKSLYTGAGDCLGPSNTLNLPANFYQSSTGQNILATVVCAPDPDLSVSDGGFAFNGTNKPDNALEVRRSSSSFFNSFEGAINVRANNNKSVRVKGPIASNNTIDVDQGFLRSTSTIKARSFCTANRVISTPPPANCDLHTDPGENPTYTESLSGVSDQSVPTAQCTGTNKVITFQPGRYSGHRDTDDLNDLTRSSSRCRGSTFYFPPGIYVFDLDDDWSIDTGSVIAGKATTGADPGVNPAVPGACKSAIPPSPFPAGGWTSKQGAGDGGAVFVFQGQSRLRLRNTKFEICAPYSATRPPVAFLGWPSGPDKQSGCVMASIIDPFFGCPVIYTSGDASGTKFIVQGTTWFPNNALDLNIASGSVQQFRAGAIVRSAHIDIPGSGPEPNYPIFELPDDSAGTGLRTVVNLNVYVCPGAATCTAATGTLRLQAKVALTDSTGSPVAGNRPVTVYNWNVKR